MAQQHLDSDDSSDAESFHSLDNDSPSAPQAPTKPSPTNQPVLNPSDHPLDHRFPPAEEANLLAESHTLKTTANTLFGTGSFENAIQTYGKALSFCPNYLDYELAILRSNVAACHLKLQEWKQAVESAGKGLENLERLEPVPDVRAGKKDGAVEEGKMLEEDGVEEVDEQMEARMQRLQESGHSLDEVRKLQVKLLMRRAKARTEEEGWAALQGAEEDYRTILHPSLNGSITATDRRQVEQAVRVLGPKLDGAREREMAEMMGKLKGLGNSILKPFGLSTDNFNFVKDENSGGYSMNFDQGGGGKAK